ncbi:DUF2235 domain-containing protein [Methylobacterium sp. Leaf469]|uniref:T6SS phospholipase effector Tle1-like catalytic domain-containing protein n=1 Tax=Methylobacterium sp. Leaf469 TaxID=1736387 RepID=UPI0009E9D3C4|nr:DUF2235 domain-containing protein [Methylobacterium sp. Leaf469]
MAKSMIFLFDGTANSATSRAFTNVYALNQLIAEHREINTNGGISYQTQVTFYLPGIGTNFTVKEPERGGIIRSVGQIVFGDGLEQLILRAYINLCANFRRGDEIILIGFSRGSAAARIFSRLVSDFGILRSKTLMFMDRLWNDFLTISAVKGDIEYFNMISALHSRLASENKGERVFHQSDEVSIKFLGVFDTVIGAYDGKLPSNLDFRDSTPASKVENAVHLMSMHDVRELFELKRFRPVLNSKTNLREIWVPGVHSDVGGGYVEDFISNISLLTMAALMKQYAGVALDLKPHNEIIDNIRSKNSNNLIVVNREPFPGPALSRKDDINIGDELHPLHFYMKNKNVFWKHDKNTETYRDDYFKLKSNTKIDLVDLISDWLNVNKDSFF